ncbi:hypothetical protein [Paenibacillus sp. FSL R7-0333]|uniref:hypothetical protein n=1 Tax=Paenibacillus sp. FSL R7-0333 TaxID=1926587 RepID=UPI0011801A94
MLASLLQNYWKMINHPRSYGGVRKCEFHIYTPKSHDYRLIPNRKFEGISVTELIEILHISGYFNEEQRGINEKT